MRPADRASPRASARPPSGSNLPTGTAGMQVLTITATDNVGNVFVKTVNYRVLDATNTNGTVGGTVPRDAGA